MADTAAIPQNFELAPISRIRSTLDNVFGMGAWANWEPETILLELGIPPTNLFLDKLNVLRIMEVEPLMFYHEPTFFLYAADVMSNNEADFDHVPHITLLEAAWALHEAKKLAKGNPVVLTDNDYKPLSKVCEYILRNDGASVPISPFEFVPADSLEQGQTKEDTENKKKAVAQYIAHMESL